jgi:hypothetical protein
MEAKRRFSGMAVWPWPLLLPTGRPTGRLRAQAQTILAAFTARPWRPPLQVRMQRHRADRLFYRSSLC